MNKGDALAGALLAEGHGLGRVRTARKPWRCRCANVAIAYEVVYTDPSRPHVLEMRETCRSETEATNRADAHRNRGYSVQEISVIPNPNYRADCESDIPVGTRYFEYEGDTAAYQSGSRYCLSCAAAVWSGFTS